MTTFYNRTKDNVCPGVLQSEIEDDVTITTVIEYIRVDNEVDISFAFAASLPMPEETQLDVLLAAHTCDRTDESDDNGEDTSGESVSLTNTPTGRLFQLHFHENGDVMDKWLQTAESVSSNYSPHIIPWDSKLIAIAYSNEKNDKTATLELYKSDYNAGGTEVLDFSWAVNNIRTGVQKDFGGDLLYTKGDKLLMYVDGGTLRKVNVILYFAITEETNTTDTITESFSGKF